MTYFYPKAMQNLIDQLTKLPGVGPKSAQRMSFYLLHAQDANELADSIINAKDKIHRCPVCSNLTDSKLCPVCQDSKRDRSMLCVVEQPRDVVAMEKSREYNGLYHVLHGSINPMEGIGPSQLTLDQLKNRLNNEVFSEIILALNPNVEGEATALYVARLLKGTNIKISKIAYGVPVGGDLEYADEATLAQALMGRHQL